MASFALDSVSWAAALPRNLTELSVNLNSPLHFNDAVALPQWLKKLEISSKIDAKSFPAYEPPKESAFPTENLHPFWPSSLESFTQDICTEYPHVIPSNITYACFACGSEPENPSIDGFRLPRSLTHLRLDAFGSTVHISNKLPDLTYFEITRQLDVQALTESSLLALPASLLTLDLMVDIERVDNKPLDPFWHLLPHLTSINMQYWPLDRLREIPRTVTSLALDLPEARNHAQAEDIFQDLPGGLKNLHLLFESDDEVRMSSRSFSTLASLESLIIGPQMLFPPQVLRNIPPTIKVLGISYFDLETLDAHAQFIPRRPTNLELPTKYITNTVASHWPLTYPLPSVAGAEQKEIVKQRIAAAVRNDEW